ncbi:CRISPR-associated endonuclease Cas2 [Patescibacteria group bacterium]|nr:CRISPR-associated endonuclease Cas2 [Patescibacteria group bacterium]MBU2633188.1 CRISPR-associated endonuclease Cas2 [Patescibacteria group bacterium]
MKTKYSRGELSREILKGLALGGFIAICFVAPNFAQVAKLFDTKSSKDRWRLRRTLSNLTREKLVKISYNKKGEEIIKITGDGEKRILKYKYEDVKISIPKKWDKMWRLVMFDIPEIHKKARNALTFKLQDLGFYPLQKSVFILPYECRNETDFICEHFKIREFVNYFVLKDIENEGYLKEWFDL